MAQDVHTRANRARRLHRAAAAALAAAFAALTLLPWLHTLTADRAAGGHACCSHEHAHREPAPAPASPLPGLAAPAAPHDACWICQNLASLLHHAPQARVDARVLPPPLPARHTPRPVRTAAHTHLYPACRSQAPPARA